MPGKRVQFEDETWQAIEAVARGKRTSFQELADEAFDDLLKKYKQPVGLMASLSKRALGLHERPKTKSPARDGAEFAIWRLPIRSHAIIEALPQIGCRSPATLAPKIKGHEALAPLRPKLPKKKPRYGGSGASPVPRSSPRNLVGDGDQPTRQAYNCPHNQFDFS
jgi:hypothetical protein